MNELAVLLKKVHEAQRQKKYDNLTETEREVINLLLSLLREGIIKGKFYHNFKRQHKFSIPLLEMHFNLQYVNISVHYVGGISFKAVKQSACRVREEVIVDFLKELGLTCSKKKFQEQISIELEMEKTP